MSRSYKRTPVIKDSGRSKKEDRSIANRRVRRKLKNPEYESGNGNAYKKETESWNIADYVSRWTKEEATVYYNDPRNEWVRQEYPTLERWLQQWQKEMLRK